MASNLIQKIRNVGRLTQIVNVFARHGFKKELAGTELGEFLSPGAEVPPNRDDPLTWAQRLVAAFEELGPTFVKLGQLLASREDLLPRSLILELKRLQDRARPFSRETLEKILDAEFGTKRAELLELVDPMPLGAASIGQVHRAILKDGREVVLKVQRPEVDHVIRTDLSILMGIASIVESATPELRALRPTVIIEELSRSLHAELDYFREAANTDRARNFFSDDDKIYIPAVYRECCTRKVLCLEFIRGTKLTHPSPEHDRKALVTLGVRAFLDMCFTLGMFHADLHPGNFILLEDGRLAILDFGLTARLSKELRETLSLMFLALMKEDLDSFSRLFMDLTEPSASSDRNGLQAEIRDVIDTAFSVKLSELQLGRVLMQVARICAAHNAPVSRELVLFFRGVVALETFGRTLDPDFEVLHETASYARTLQFQGLTRAWLERESVFVLRDMQVLLRELPTTLKLLTRKAQAGQLAVHVESEGMRDLARELDKASHRVSMALMLAALVVGGSILTFGKSGGVFDLLSKFGLVAFALAALVGVWIVLSILRSGRYK